MHAVLALRSMLFYTLPDPARVDMPAVSFSHLIIRPVDLLSVPAAGDGTPLYCLPPRFDESLAAAAREVLDQNFLIV